MPAIQSPVTEEIHPDVALVERAKVPFIVANASATSIAEKSGVGGNEWTFKVNPTDASMLDALVAWLDKEGKADNIAFLGEDTDYGRAGSAGFESAFAEAFFGSAVDTAAAASAGGLALI